MKKGNWLSMALGLLVMGGAVGCKSSGVQKLLGQDDSSPTSSSAPVAAQGDPNPYRSTTGIAQLSGVISRGMGYGQKIQGQLTATISESGMTGMHMELSMLKEGLALYGKGKTVTDKKGHIVAIHGDMVSRDSKIHYSLQLTVRPYGYGKNSPAEQVDLIMQGTDRSLIRMNGSWLVK